MAKGFHLKFSVDYDENFGLVVSNNVLPVTVKKVVAKGWHFRETDISYAFFTELSTAKCIKLLSFSMD